MPQEQLAAAAAAAEVVNRPVEMHSNRKVNIAADFSSDFPSPSGFGSTNVQFSQYPPPSKTDYSIAPNIQIKEIPTEQLIFLEDGTTLLHPNLIKDPSPVHQNLWNSLANKQQAAPVQPQQQKLNENFHRGKFSKFSRNINIILSLDWPKPIVAHIASVICR